MIWIFGHFIQMFSNSNFSWFFYKLMTLFLNGNCQLTSGFWVFCWVLDCSEVFLKFWSFGSLTFLPSLRWPSRTLSRIISWPSILPRIRNYTCSLRGLFDTFPHIFDKLFGLVFDRIGVIVFGWSTIVIIIFWRFWLSGCRFLGLTALVYRKKQGLVPTQSDKW